jgi:hypothetical protein
LSFTSETIKGVRYIVLYKSGKKAYLLKADTGANHNKWVEKFKEMEREHQENRGFNARPEINKELRSRIE